MDILLRECVTVWSSHSLLFILCSGRIAENIQIWQGGGSACWRNQEATQNRNTKKVLMLVYNNNMWNILLFFSSRWFFHFYLFACTFYIILTWSIFQVYVMRYNFSFSILFTKRFNNLCLIIEFFCVHRHNVPQLIQFLLDSFVGTHRRATGNFNRRVFSCNDYY